MAQIEDYLDEIEDILEKGRGNAFSGKVTVDAAAIKTVIEDMRLDVPEEIKEAKMIASERREIINRANREADSILDDAREKGRDLLAAAEKRSADMNDQADRVTRESEEQARNTARQILDEARAQADDMIARETVVQDSQKRADELDEKDCQ